MEALILSCATGGGHNAAAQAMHEELVRRGHRADILDPYTLFGKAAAARVGGCYVQCAQKAPGLFGGIYRLGDLCRRLPGKSPVYWANKKAADRMQEYLRAHSYDVILTTHLFPGEILTHLRRRGVPLPKLIFIATDYTCIPFTEEIACDYFVIPSTMQKQEFCSWGIPPEKIIPIGIPVKRGFREKADRERTLARLGLDPQNRYILLAGGSIGAGEIYEAVRILQGYLQEHREVVLIVVCGTNQKLYRKMAEKYHDEPQLLLLKNTEHIAAYLQVCELYISKPGGISSTEAAVANIPLIHISPIPGCETRNASFFAACGMSIGVSNLKKELLQAVRRSTNRETVVKMTEAQRKAVDPSAAEKIAAFAEELAAGTR